jgi:hypothetical protein
VRTPDPPPDISKLEIRDLLSLYRGILRELKSREVIRTENAPTGDYAEYLVARALGGRLANNSEKSWDIELADGAHIQVKSRVVSDPPRAGQRQLSPFRSFDFDAAVVVLLRDSDFEIERAVMLPRSVIELSSRYRSHVNGHVMFATPEVLDHPLAEDLTSRLRAATGATSGESR